MMEMVPSPDWEIGHEALDRLLAGKVSVSAAVAFISRAGAETLSALFDRHKGIEEVYIVARGAPI